MKKRIIILLFLSLVFFSCSKKDTIIVAGSSTILPVMARAADRFMEENPSITIIVNAGGSGVGINQLGERMIDIGMSSRDITKAEYAKYSDNSFTIHIIGKDAVVPVVSKQIYAARIRVLSLNVIGKIYKGTISNWAEIGGPDKDILVVDKEASRGTRHVFMKALFGDSQAHADGADLVLGSNNEEQLAVSQSDRAIGMLSYAWVNNDVKGISIATKSGPVAPTKKNITDGLFPIIRDLIIITNNKPKPIIGKFIEYLLSNEGQKIVDEAGYVRYNE